MSLVRTLPDLPSRYRARAFRAIESVLREDPVLVNVVRSWRSRRGIEGEMSPPTVPEMPLIGLSPVPRPSEIMSETDLKVNFAVSVQLFVEGTCVEDILALWEAIEDAIMDDKPFRQTTVGDFLCTCVDEEKKVGLHRLYAAEPAFFGVDHGKPPKQVQSQGGVGLLACFLRRPTRLHPQF